MKKIFISYFVSKISDTESTKFFDRAVLELENTILSEEDLDEIENQIKMLYNSNNDDCVDVVIINWKGLSA